MTKDRYQRGCETMVQLAGEQGKQALEGVKAFSPAFAQLIAETFGDIYTRPVLSLQQRELVTLSSLITQGADENQLQFHFHAALHAGLTVEELIEVIMHCTAYAGFPRALSALQILQKMLADKETNR